ncbi:HK97 family phage prohead protease [Rhodococcus globerulus]|uniref:HK97 family phage prohead protease n=1 Tax=Rhodococcus globerulus TaxID=33008 RepID=A0ABU4BSQ4_RHOGO|nr:HK97 family phage prohead protease [Rhodococcus globerulus]MDV6267068.1 HK97 family phage prohead protease [Rhodococcus globerulus]
MKIKSCPIRVKAGPEDGLEEGEFLVYPSTFTRTPDSYGDVVAKGAFIDTIAAWKESGNVLPGLYGHRLDDPDFFVAAALDMGEDDHGWWVKGVFDLESPKGAQVYRLVKGRRINQLSFAFETLDEGSVELEDGGKANELRKVNVYEFSFVPVGANQDTSIVAVKALADQIAADVKAGRAISAKNEQVLREAAEKVIGAAKDIEEVLSAALAVEEENEDQDQASGTGPSPEKRPDQAPPVKASPNPSVSLAAELLLLSVTDVAEKGVLL